MEDNGKYIIGGEEIEVDYSKDLPLHTLNKLESTPVSMLDTYYIRKHLHHFSNWADTMTLDVDNRLLEVERKLGEVARLEKVCQTDVIPKIVEGKVHDIVNGSLNKINAKLDSLAEENKESVETSKKVHETLNTFNKELIAKIEDVGNKTIYGAVINGFKKNFIRSAIIAFVLSGFFFAYIMAIFKIDDFTDLINGIWNFFK